MEEPKINTQKIEATMPMEHLDEEAKATVDKLVYDEHQKKLGLPTSKEQVRIKSKGLVFLFTDNFWQL